MREAEIEIQTADGMMDTFICHPEEDGPHPAVIMYMDAPGIREELRDMARRLGTTGYYVMLPNMYYRTGREGHYGFDRSKTSTGDEAEREKMFAVMNSLTNALVIADTAPMLEHIRGAEAAADGGIGCVGYCMSGQYVMSVGSTYPNDFAAIASYYGVGLITDQDDSPHLYADKIKGEVYLGFAEEDPVVPQEIVDALPDKLTQAGVNHRIEVYPGTGHGFAFPQRPIYVREAGERHWERMLALYERNLKG